MGPRDSAEASRTGPESIQASSQPPASAASSGQDAFCSTSCILTSRGSLAFHAVLVSMVSCISWRSYMSATSTTTDLSSWNDDEFLPIQGIYAARFYENVASTMAALSTSCPPKGRLDDGISYKKVAGYTLQKPTLLRHLCCIGYGDYPNLQDVFSSFVLAIEDCRKTLYFVRPKECKCQSPLPLWILSCLDSVPPVEIVVVSITFGTVDSTDSCRCCLMFSRHDGLIVPVNGFEFLTQPSPVLIDIIFAKKLTSFGTSTTFVDNVRGNSTIPNKVFAKSSKIDFGHDKSSQEFPTSADFSR